MKRINVHTQKIVDVTIDADPEALPMWPKIDFAHRPKFAIGDRIAMFKPRHADDGRYYLRKLVKRYKARGARSILDFIANAESFTITIIAAEPFFCQPCYGIANQCYLNGVPGAASGMSWNYKVLLAGHHKGNSVCVILDVWIAESALHANR